MVKKFIISNIEKYSKIQYVRNDSRMFIMSGKLMNIFKKFAAAATVTAMVTGSCVAFPSLINAAEVMYRSSGTQAAVKNGDVYQKFSLYKESRVTLCFITSENIFVSGKVVSTDEKDSERDVFTIYSSSFNNHGDKYIGVSTTKELRAGDYELSYYFGGDTQYEVLIILGDSSDVSDILNGDIDSGTGSIDSGAVSGEGTGSGDSSDVSDILNGDIDSGTGSIDSGAVSGEGTGSEAVSGGVTTESDSGIAGTPKIVYQSESPETASRGIVNSYQFALGMKSDIAIAVAGTPKAIISAEMVDNITGDSMWSSTFSDADYTSEIDGEYIAAKMAKGVDIGSYTLKLIFSDDVRYSLAIAVNETVPSVPDRTDTPNVPDKHIPEVPVTPTVPEKPSVMPVVPAPDEELAAISTNYLDLATGCTSTIKVTGIKNGVVWNSTNESVAAVSNGKVTAKKTGTAIVTASVKGQTLKCKVHVSKNILTEKKATVKNVNDGRMALKPYLVKFNSNGDLIVKGSAVNRTGNTITHLKNVKVKVKTKQGATIGTYKISKQSFSLTDDKAKVITFVIKKNDLKLKSGVDLRAANAAIEGKYLYTYRK